MKIFVTGYGLVSSLGNNPERMFHSLLEGRTAIRKMENWTHLKGLHTFLGAPAEPYDSKIIPRTVRRTMSAMSEMAALAAFDALAMAKISRETIANNDRALLSMGSSSGSPEALETYFKKYFERGGPESQPGTAFFKIMNHSVPSNVASALGFNGAVISPSCACATATQSLILGWELIQSGLYDMAICGGADELHSNSAAVFDGVYAASRNYNDKPSMAVRPFDKKRDGLVVSEGASVIILESERSLEKRGGQPLAQLSGGAYLCESTHLSQSNSQMMTKVMDLALKRSSVKKESIEYVSAHATGTIQGDEQEALAIRELFGKSIPVSSLKGHFGHSMAACGGIELIAMIKMMESGILIGTRNLDEIDPSCDKVQHLTANQKIAITSALSNNFAFGGINTSFVVQKV